MQCLRIRKLISDGNRDELEAQRKAERRKCSKALAPILDIIRKNAVHASLKAVDAPPSLYRIWKIRALCWVLRRLRAGQRGWRDEGGIQISP
jgi:hypothetical protein